MRELDALLIRFVEDVYESLSKDDKHRFGALLELPDPGFIPTLWDGMNPPTPTSKGSSTVFVRLA
ncbi:MAG: hypothetical protein CM1200mP36_02140 [Gammaproteobacteria bacterium]|nr:MAG: hypothetical protein CM1200mP36_02140 [Gammaproteobacteria bacterium]